MDKKKKNKTQLLIELALANCSLWHSQDSKAYATFNGENWALDSSRFAGWLTGLFYNHYNDAPSDTALKGARQVLSHKALNEQHYPVFIRVGRVKDTIYLDLGNEQWEAVKITSSGWEVISNPPVKFIRSNNTGALPLPEKGGNLDELMPLATRSASNWLRLKGTILDALKGYGPYLVSIIHGPQGSAKSYVCGLLRSLIDPLKAGALSSLPRDLQALAVDSGAEHLLAYENISSLSQVISDGLCLIATGGGFKCRKLYTDGEQVIISAVRPILLNGIPCMAESNDLLSRALLVEQPMIGEAERKEKAELDARFAEMKGRVFGAVCSLLANGLRNLPDTKLEHLPRQADSVRWVSACFGDHAFLDEYRRNEIEAMEAGLDASPIARGIALLFSGGVNCWEGTTARLLEDLGRLIPYEHRGRDFPITPKALGKRIIRDIPYLQQAGLRVERTKSHGERYIRIEKATPPDASPTACPAKPDKPTDELLKRQQSETIVKTFGKDDGPFLWCVPSIEGNRVSRSRYRVGWTSSPNLPPKVWRAEIEEARIKSWALEHLPA